MTINGTFKLTKYGYTYKDDGRFEPISKWYGGEIHYSDTGFMSVIIRFAEEPNMKEFVAYCGVYKIEGDTISHRVTTSARPEYEGQILDRKFKLDGKTLELEFENTEGFKKFALWEKIL